MKNILFFSALLISLCLVSGRRMNAVPLSASENNTAAYEPGMGIDEITLNEQGLYPNPFTSNFYIACESTRDLDVRIDITDLSGNIVYGVTRKVLIGTNKIEVSPNQLNSGLYVMHMITERGQISIQILKN